MTGRDDDFNLLRGILRNYQEGFAALARVEDEIARLERDEADWHRIADDNLDRVYAADQQAEAVKAQVVRLREAVSSRQTGERTMTEQQVRERIRKITAQAGDYEAAHSSEDELWWDVLSAIANGECEHPQILAALALATRDIDFPRYTA